jgi:hypothetical protein
MAVTPPRPFLIIADATERARQPEVNKKAALERRF